MNCNHCQGPCIKKGKYKTAQLYRCKTCFKYQRSIYKKSTITAAQEKLLVQLNNEGMSISSLSRLLQITKSSVQRKILALSKTVTTATQAAPFQEYETDELRTYIGSKKNECWIIYAIEKTTRKVIDYTVGRRNTVNISKVIDSVISLSPKRIFTDKLNIYRELIPKEKHCPSGYSINHIERMNLNLRTHLKCLSRRTICFSKSEEVLQARVGLYFSCKSAGLR
jgi:insertion element IS1 protein InsB